VALVVKNTKQLIDPANLRLKILAFGYPGSGKTTFAADAPNPGIAVCETGHGKGLIGIAQRGLDYVEPANYGEFDQVCSGLVFKDKQTIVLDSLSDMCRTFIKDYALSFPRAKGESQKRKAGVPELDDYGVMGEVTRRLVRKLLDSDKHVIATSTLKINMPDAETGQGDMLVCPDLPGAMSLGSTAMFDIVLCFRTRSVLRDKNDAKSRYTQHYITAKGSQNLTAKCRHNEVIGKSLLPDEFIYDPATGDGTFTWILKRIQDGYTEAVKKAA